MTCLAAFTDDTPADGCYVGYINAYELSDGTVRVALRPEAEEPEVAELHMTATAWANFIMAAVFNGSPRLAGMIAERIGLKDVACGGASDA